MKENAANHVAEKDNSHPPKTSFSTQASPSSFPPSSFDSSKDEHRKRSHSLSSSSLQRPLLSEGLRSYDDSHLLSSQTSSPLQRNHNSSSSPSNLLARGRARGSEASIREEMFRDFTFRPTIKPIPEFYGAPAPDPSPFYSRVLKWKKEVSSENELRKVRQEQARMRDCTFQPK